jgi:hypothetical protein
VLEEIFPANDVDALRDVISDQFVNHEAPPGTPPGLGGITMFMHMLNEAFSDQRWDIHHVLAEGDKVVIHCTHGGVHTGDSATSDCRPLVAASPTSRCTSSASSMANASSTGRYATTHPLPGSSRLIGHQSQAGAHPPAAAQRM